MALLYQTLSAAVSSSVRKDFGRGLCSQSDQGSKLTLSVVSLTP